MPQVTINLNRKTSARQRTSVSGEVRFPVNLNTDFGVPMLEIFLILSPATNPTGTVKAEKRMARGAKKMDSGTAVPGYTQAGIPVAYFTSGNMATAINAEPAPSNALEDRFCQLCFLKMAKSKRIANPSRRKANIGFPMAPCRTGRDSNTASNSLNRHAISTTRTGM